MLAVRFNAPPTSHPGEGGTRFILDQLRSFTKNMDEISRPPNRNSQTARLRCDAGHLHNLRHLQQAVELPWTRSRLYNV